MDNFGKPLRPSRSRYSNVDGFVASPKKTPRLVKQQDLSKSPAYSPTLRAMPAPHSSASRPVQSTNGHTFNDNEATYKRSRFRRNNRGQKSTYRKVIFRTFVALLIVIIGVGAFLGIRGLNTIDKVFHGNVFSDVTAAFSSKPLNGESTGRVNILLAGDSSDDPGHGGADLTDSILVLSIDTKNNTAFMISIPRDLWVNIPGYGWQKINAANNAYGTNFPGYPQNGMGQLEHIIVTDLGIPINYYALANYSAFRQSVNAVNGVTVNINSPDPRGLYDPNTNLKLANGPVTLNGLQALDLARARGDGPGSYGFPDSDFDRTQHQREIFTAVAQKAATIGVLSNPVKISDLFNALGNNVQTDLSLQNVLRLVQISKKINLNNIKSYSYCSTLNIGQNGCTKALLTDYTDPASGAEALIPSSGIGEYGEMQQYYQQLVSSNPVVKENANIVILNASNVIGLAKKQQEVLESKGAYVSTIADANNEYSNTMIVDSSGGTKPATLKLLQQLYPGSTVISKTTPAEATEAQGYTDDFTVILGLNWTSINQ